MTCAVDGCGKDDRVQGLCSGHYHRLTRYGSPTGVPAPRPRGVCAVDGCEGALAGGGYCRKHYKRFRVHGDPTAGATYKGDVVAFLRAVANSDTDKCVPFPFFRNSSGYGHINFRGRYMGAHVFVAEEVLGEKPSAKHEVCHTCGNGADGCVNGRHLYWGTRKQNVADTIAHGTARFWGRYP